MAALEFCFRTSRRHSAVILCVRRYLPSQKPVCDALAVLQDLEERSRDLRRRVQGTQCMGSSLRDNGKARQGPSLLRLENALVHVEGEREGDSFRQARRPLEGIGTDANRGISIDRFLLQLSEGPV